MTRGWNCREQCQGQAPALCPECSRIQGQLEEAQRAIIAAATCAVEARDRADAPATEFYLQSLARHVRTERDTCAAFRARTRDFDSPAA